jgi:hypothetical protein
MESLVNESFTGIVLGSLAFGAALLWFRSGSSIRGNDDRLTIISSLTRGTRSEEEHDDPIDVGKRDHVNSNQHQPSKKLLRNVFSVKQKPIVMDESSSSSPTSARPFESSYYFAHNRQSTG